MTKITIILQLLILFNFYSCKTSEQNFNKKAYSLEATEFNNNKNLTIVDSQDIIISSDSLGSNCLLVYNNAVSIADSKTVLDTLNYKIFDHKLVEVSSNDSIRFNSKAITKILYIQKKN